MTLASVVFGVEIVSISNLVASFHPSYASILLPKRLQARRAQEAHRRGWNVRDTVIFVYHHLWSSPLSPANRCNHFCYLRPVNTLMC
jgi:hypothetical protein